jgi:hypothetical protein
MKWSDLTIIGLLTQIRDGSGGGGGGTVTAVTGTAPVVSSGGATPAISLPVATASVDGYISHTDWGTFNSKGAGTVTAVSVATANGISGSSSGGATPVLTLRLVDGTQLFDTSTPHKVVFDAAARSIYDENNAELMHWTNGDVRFAGGSIILLGNGVIDGAGLSLDGSITLDSGGFVFAGSTVVDFASADNSKGSKIRSKDGNTYFDNTGFHGQGSVNAPVEKTTTYTAVAGDYILANTSSGSFTITLPPSPSVGDRGITVVDSQGSFATHFLTIGRNSSLIAGAASDLTASTNNSAFSLVFAGGSMGWQVIHFQ